MTIQLRVHKKQMLSDDTCCIWFEPLSNFTYKPGQYITLLLNINGREVRRPYSLSSYAVVDELPFITVKRIENGEATRYLLEQLQAQEIVSCLVPNGRFVLPQQLPQKLVFIAAGSGISPILGLIKQALHDSNAEVILLYSNKSSATTLYAETLIQLQSHYPNRLTIHYFYSDSKNLMKARLSRINLEEIMQPIINDDLLVYTCGPFVYMEMVFITLLTMGLSPSQLFKETFYAEEEEDDEDGSLLDDEERPQYVSATVQVNRNGKVYAFNTLPEQTLLGAALLQGIDLPYSCKNGMCSSCVCELKSGKVHMHYNQVLTDNEVAQGRVLTCTAHGLTNEIILNFDEQ